MAAFTTYTGNADASLTSALLAPNSGINIVNGSIALHASGADAVNFYDGSLSALGIGAGLLLTSGTTPGTANTVGWFGTDNAGNGDADIDAVVNTVFQTQSYDATTLAFDFTLADPGATSISFDVVFGSDEFPEWVDQFVDSAVVMVNGVHYALFNHDPTHPLSVVSANLAAGYFQDNAGNVLPIEYDGVSHVLKIIAPVNPGMVNHIKIGIADTGDHIYDSGIFLSNLSAGTIPGSGVVVAPTTGSAGDDVLNGSAKDEYFDVKAGNDIVYAGAGDDIVVAGAGDDKLFGGSGADQLKGDAGNDQLDGGADLDTAVYAGAKADYAISFDGASGQYSVSSVADGVDTLSAVEFAQFSDGLYSLGANGVVTLVGTPGPVLPPANQPGIVFLSGVGGQGQTLKASVSDADGVPAAGVSYAWQADGVDLGVSGATLTVGAADVGKNITVSASYVDLAGNAEALTSAAKYIAASGNGDFTITLLNLSAPVGVAVMNPLTTLVQNAIALGVMPNEAGSIVKGALGIGASIDILHVDPWAALQANPNDAGALALEKKLVQVAVMTSLGSDETGMALTQAILLAHSQGTQLDLANEATIASLLGLDPANALVHEIWDRNDTIGAAHSVAAIETIWLDLQSGLDVVLSNSIATLNLHLNQAPVGSASASLADGTQDSDYFISNASLLQGFSDPDGDALQVVGLTVDAAGTLQAQADGWLFTPAPGYSGPVEVSYQVDDGNGASAPASQLFVIAPGAVVPENHAPTGALLIDGQPTQGQTLSLQDTIADADGMGTLSYQWLADGSVIGTGATLTLTEALVGKSIAAVASYVDGLGKAESVNSAATAPVANLNDAPTGTVTVTGVAAQNQTLSAANSLADADGLGTIAYQWLADGVAISGATSATLVLGEVQVGQTIAVSASYTDGHGTYEQVTSSASAAVANVNDAPTGGIAIAGTAVQGQTLAAQSTLADADGLGALTYQWKADGSAIAGATASSLTLTSAQVGKAISVVASYVDGHGTAESVASGASAVVAGYQQGTAGADSLTGTAFGDSLFGLAGADTLSGGAGDDVLDGGAGADTMQGGAGNDTYLVDNALDKVFETTSIKGKTDAGGVDTVQSSVTWTLGDFVENLSLTGALAINGSGNALANVITGNGMANTLAGLAGNDQLDGGDGADILIGGAGNDTLRGGAGADQFRFDSAPNASTNIDTLFDFQHGVDKLALDHQVFKKLAVGALGAANFRASAGGAAADGNDYLLYDTNTGALSYDADGSGKGAAIQIAILVGTPSLDAADFVVI